MKVPSDAIVYEGAVPFHDCDPLGIVWHGHYYKYLELARTVLLSGYRLDVGDFMALGRKLFMIETRCRHVAPLHYGDRYRIRTWLIDFEQRLHIGYEVWNVTTDRRAAKAWTTLVTTDQEGNMLIVTPIDVLERIHGGWSADA